MSNAVDAFIIISFLLGTLVVGLVQRKKVNDISDYALGGRNFSTGALVATIVATWVSGSSFATTLSKTYDSGLVCLIVFSGVSISFLLTAFIFIPRMGIFLGKTSVAEALGSFYGDKVRIITGISGSIGKSGFIAVQFKVFGTIFAEFFNIPHELSVIVAGMIVILYSALGGIRAVTFTDVLQFLTFGAAIPLVGIIIWSHAPFEKTAIHDALQSPQFNIKTILNINNPDLLGIIVLTLAFAVPGMNPALFQRFSMGQNIIQAKKAFVISAFIILTAFAAMAWIPFLIKIIEPNLKGNQVMYYIISNYTYSGFKGMVIVGVIAMAMSTADSYLNSSSVLFGHDVCMPLNVNPKWELLISKVFSICLGLISILLALSAQDLMSIILFADSFYMPLTTAPFLITILGFRTTAKPILIGMFVGLFANIIWKIMQIEINSIFPCITLNLIFLLGSHYILKQPGGWVNTKNNLNGRKKTKINLKQKISNLKIIELCRKYSPINELSYTGLGVYLIIYTISTMYSTQVELLKPHGTVILGIYQSMMVTGVMLAMYPIWPYRIKKLIFVQVAWPIVIFVMLIFYSMFFVMVSNFHQLQFIIFTINVIIAILLAGWKLATCMIIAGLYLASLSYKTYMGIDTLDLSIGSPQFIFMYSILLIGAVIAIFLKPNQEKQALVKQKIDYQTDKMSHQKIALSKALNLKYEFLRNLEHETNNPLTGIKSTIDVFYNSYSKLTDTQRMECAETIHSSSVRLQGYITNITDLSKLTSLRYEFNMEKVDLAQLIYERIDMCKKLYIAKENQDKYEFIFDIQANINVTCDKYYITQVLDNIIINAIQYSKGGNITVSLYAQKKNVIVTVQDEGIGIPAHNLRDIFGAFVVSSKTKTPAGGRGVGLALCKKVIDLHGGDIRAESDGKSWSVFTFMLPINNTKN